MPRTRRQAPGGYVYHALNRAVARLPLFKKSRDYEAFFRVLDEALIRHPIRILGYCVMPNHWHFVLWPRKEGDLTAFLRWLTHTHTMRWHTHYHTAGTGHLYQGRFKSFPVEADDYFYTLMRYVERNALRAGLVQRAEDWPWGSLAFRAKGWEPTRALSALGRCRFRPTGWLVCTSRRRKRNWHALRRSVNRGAPYGSEVWQRKTAGRLDLGCTRCVRPAGRRSTPATRRSENEPRPLFFSEWYSTNDPECDRVQCGPRPTWDTVHMKKRSFKKHWQKNIGRDLDYLREKIAPAELPSFSKDIFPEMEVRSYFNDGVQLCYADQVELAHKYFERAIEINGHLVKSDKFRSKRCKKFFPVNRGEAGRRGVCPNHARRRNAVGSPQCFCE